MALPAMTGLVVSNGAQDLMMFFCIMNWCEYLNLSDSFASDVRRRGKQFRACSLDSFYGQSIGQQGNGLDFNVCKIIGGSVSNKLRACMAILKQHFNPSCYGSNGN